MRRKEPKKQKQASPERLAKILDVPQNMFESYSQIVLSGNREAVLDGCQGVIEYEDQIKDRQTDGKIHWAKFTD